ncbi:MAG: hypothetical protein WBJ37_05160, partial [Bacteroidales bacterium]
IEAKRIKEENKVKQIGESPETYIGYFLLKSIYDCFLQVLFPESCKIFFHSIATGISTMLQTVFC